MNNPLENLTPGKNEGDVKIYRKGVEEIIPAKEAPIALKVEAAALGVELASLRKQKQDILDQIKMKEDSSDYSGIEEAQATLRKVQNKIEEKELSLRSLNGGGVVN
jgi:hypothetical protein